MRVFDRILGNAAILAAARVFQKLASFVLLWMLARGLTPEEFGLYSFVMVWVAFAGTVTDLGSSAGAVRLWAEDARRMARALPRLLILRLGLAGIGALVSVPLWLVLYPALPAWALTWVVVGTVIQAHSVAWAPFQAELANREPAVRASLNRVLVILAVAGVLLVGGGVGGVLAAETLVPLLFAWWIVAEARARARDRAGDAEPFSPAEVFRHCLPLGISSLLLMAYFRVDVFLLMNMKGEADVARYAAGYRLVEPLLTFPGVLAASVMPVVVARWTGGDRDGALRAVGRFARIGPVALALVAIPLSRHAEFLMTALFGEPYRASGSVMSLLAWTLPLSAWAYAWHPLILADKRYGYNIAVASLALAGNVLGNLWAIPRWGIVGSAALTVATELWWALGVSAPALIAHASARRILARTAFAGMVVALAWAGVASLPGMVGTAVILVVSAVVALGCGLVERDDLDGIGRAIRTRVGSMR